MPDTREFSLVFDRLKVILDEFAPRLQVQQDAPGNYSLYEPEYEWQGKPLEMYFAGVQVRKNYVSYYLMPVYMFPDLLEGISPALEKRRQGKSCFNFTRLDEPLLAELSELTRRGFERFAGAGPGLPTSRA